MAHQKEVEKSKYRNWVRGGLAYKYLKQGIEGFADEIVQQEHTRILQKINHSYGLTCNQCSVGSFRPLHASTGKGTCPRGLRNCSCLNRKKKPCPNNVCDAIMEEILDSHDSNGSQPPTPNWKNTDIQKWCSYPWEVAKCFIHSPGYSNKSRASDIDAAGLLHVFINNISLRSYLSCKIPGNGTDIFSKALSRRNAIFHSSTMELEDNELNECINNIIAILEDEKELKQKLDAKQAVEKLNQSAEDILQLSNLLRMVCGLSPFLLKEISSLISENMISDESMIKYRNNDIQWTFIYYGYFSCYVPRVPWEIQNLIEDCFEECRTDDQPDVCLCDVIVKSVPFRESLSEPFFQNIVSSSVISVYYEFKNSFDFGKIKSIGCLHHLQFIRIEHVFSCKACKQLSTSLKETELLKCLILEYVQCTTKTCKGHTIEFSKHNQLQSINLKYCSVMLNSMVNTNCLENVSITKDCRHRMSHSMCKHLSLSLSRAVSLKTLNLVNIICDRDDCKWHGIDLPKHDQLHSITIESSYLFGSVVNTERLENVSITRHDSSSIPHAILENLSSLILQAASLKQLTLKDITCDRDVCVGHTIDLPKHNRLQSIEIYNCSCLLGSVVNAKCLETVSISGVYDSGTPHSMCEHISTSLSQAVSLKQLTLRNILFDSHACGGHIIDLSMHNQLQSIEIDQCSCIFLFLFNTKSPERLSIQGKDDYHTPHSMYEHLSASLSHAVSLKQLTLKNVVCDRDNCQDHTIDLSNHNQLQSIEIDRCSCLLGSVVNTQFLEKLTISRAYCYPMPHAVCKHVSSTLSQAMSLRQLVLENIVCDRHDCQSHSSNLSEHNQLQNGCVQRFSIDNHKSLEVLAVSRVSGVYELLRSCCYSQLTSLKMCDIEQYTLEINFVVQTLQRLQTLTLYGIDINKNALVVAAGMQNLKEITLQQVSMSHQTWRSFVDSLLELQHSVKVYTCRLSIQHEREGAGEIYVIQNKAVFQIDEIYGESVFDFSTKKPCLKTNHC